MAKRKGKVIEHKIKRRNAGNGFVEEIHSFLDNSRDSESNAARLSRGFHGRNERDVTDVIEEMEYATNLAELGDLVELEVADDELQYCLPISFSRNSERNTVKLASTTDRKQILLVGGDQKVDYKKVLRELGLPEQNKHLVDLGYCNTISYYTDKHHLTGPKSQATGCEYIHEFGEERWKKNGNGEKPRVVYDTINCKIMLVGGSYEISDEGIYN